MEQIEITLQSGREIQLQALRQLEAYAGVQEGAPSSWLNEKVVMGILAGERQNNRTKPYLIEPVEIPYETDTPPSRGRAVRLPHYVCLGTFVSEGSRLVVVWFQEERAPPVDEGIVNAIQEIDWDARAEKMQE